MLLSIIFTNSVNFFILHMRLLFNLLIEKLFTYEGLSFLEHRTSLDSHTFKVEK